MKFLAAILLAVSAGLGLGYLEGKQGESRQTRTYEYEEAAKRNAAVACAQSEPAAVADCVYDEITSAREQSQAEQDLDAQQWMARWAMFLTIITLLTTVISYIALRYLRDTFQQTAKGAGAATKATKAMKKANRIAQESLAAQNRPYITFVQVTNQDGCPALQWENTGNSPAQMMDSETGYLAFYPFETEKMLKAGNDVELTIRDDNLSILGRGKTITTPEANLNTGEITQFKARLIGVLIRSRVKYSSIQNPSLVYESEACLFIGLTEQGFPKARPIGNHNRST